MYNWDILSIVYPFLFFTMFKVIVDSIAKDGENNTFSNIIELKTKKQINLFKDILIEEN